MKADVFNVEYKEKVTDSSYISKLLEKHQSTDYADFEFHLRQSIIKELHQHQCQSRHFEYEAAHQCRLGRSWNAPNRR